MIMVIAMPEQHNRYDRRAQKDIANGEYDSYSVIIVAPQKYLEKNGIKMTSAKIIGGGAKSRVWLQKFS